MQQGQILEVSIDPAGTELEVAHPAGSTVLQVDDVSDFYSEDTVGGQVLVDPENKDVYTYTAVDLVNQTITVSAPTVRDYDEGEQVLVYPLINEKWAMVETEEDTEPVSAKILHSLRDRIPEGVRDPEEQEAVILDIQDGDLTVVDVIREEALIDATNIDPTTVTPEVAADWGVVVQTILDEQNAQINQDIQAILDYDIVGSAIQVAIDNAVSQANAAVSAAGTANTNATAALTSANGKNRVTHSSSAPGSTANTAGDTWFQYTDGTLTKIKAVWRGAGGTSWTQSALDTTIIPVLDIGTATAGTLAANRIDVASIAIGQSQVTGLTTALAGKETPAGAQAKADASGALARTNAVSDLKTLWGLPTDTTLINGGLIATNTILASSVVVADFTDYVRDPSFDGLGTWQTGVGWTISALGSPAPNSRNGEALGFVGTSGSAYAQANESQRVVVQPGDQFSLSLVCERQTGGTGGDISAFVFCYNKAGSYITNIAQINLTAIAADGVWRTYEASGTIPAGTATALVVIRATAGTVGAWYVDEIHLRRKNGASLIVDGGVQANHFDGNSFVGVTMTAPLFQTVATANRGIKIVSSANGSYGSLVAYDNLGTPTFTLNGQTGSVTMKGDLTSGSTITGASFKTATSGERWEITSTPANVIYAYATSGENPASITTRWNTTQSVTELTIAGHSRIAYPYPAPTVSFFNSGFRSTVSVSADDLTLTKTGSGVTAPYLTANQDVFAFGGLYTQNPGVSNANSINVLWNPSTYLLQKAASSAKRYKKNIRQVDDRALAEAGLKMQTVSHQYRKGFGGDGDPDDLRHLGFIADQGAEIGGDIDYFVIRDAKGDVETFKYEKWTVVQQSILRKHEADIVELQQEIAALKEAAVG